MKKTAFQTTIALAPLFLLLAFLGGVGAQLPSSCGKDVLCVFEGYVPQSGASGEVEELEREYDSPAQALLDDYQNMFSLSTYTRAGLSSASAAACMDLFTQFVEVTKRTPECRGKTVHCFGNKCWDVPRMLVVIANTESSCMTNPKAKWLMGCGVKLENKYELVSNDKQIQCAARLLCNGLYGKHAIGNGCSTGDMQCVLDNYSPSFENDPSLKYARVKAHDALLPA